MSRLSILLLIFTLVTGCVPSQAIKDEEILQLLEQYANQPASRDKSKPIHHHSGIHLARIDNPDDPIVEQTITLKLENAPLDRLLDQLGLDYALRNVPTLRGKATAALTNQPLLPTLRTLFADNGMDIQFQGTLLLISPTSIQAADDKSQPDVLMEKFRFQHADTRELKEVFKSLFGSNEDEGDDENDKNSGSSLKYAAIHQENAVILQGPYSDVMQALNVLKSLDTNSGHLLIEALIVLVNTEDLISVGNKISQLASGNFSDVSLDWGNMAGNTISFTQLTTAAHDLTFRAALSLLLRKNRARTIARPYLATTSGSEAKLEVVDDRYVQTTTADGEITLKPVTAGITLVMTPFVLPNEQVRIDLDITVSAFHPTSETLSRSRNEAASQMRINAGDTFVIGGMLTELSSQHVDGIPGADRIPGLNLLLSNQHAAGAKRQVLMYLTPHLWEPGMDLPVKAELDIERILEQ